MVLFSTDTRVAALIFFILMTNDDIKFISARILDFLILSYSEMWYFNQIMCFEINHHDHMYRVSLFYLFELTTCGLDKRAAICV